MRKRFYHICLAAASAAMLLSGCKGKDKEVASTPETAKEEQKEEDTKDSEDKTAKEGEEAKPKELTLWYTQPDLEPYFTEAAVSYEEKTGTKVQAVQVPALDYIETINAKSVEDSDYPDLYVATPDFLEKAKLAGLTMPAGKKVCSTENFPQKALDAVTYKGERIAYPFYTDTSVLVYNRQYVQEAPQTMEDIQMFSEAFEGDGAIQNIFVWNVNDIFVDFFAIGNYVNLGGVHGDTADEMVLNSEEIRACLGFYQALSQFFAIDKTMVNEAQVVQDFADGKTVYAIIRDDSIEDLDAKIQEAAAAGGEGASQVSYGIAMVPDLTPELQVRPLSITHSIAVNGYTKEPKEAKKFAEYLTVKQAERLYGVTGNYPAKAGITYENPELAQVTAQYEESVEVPKIMQMSSYWLLMGPVFADIWIGADVTETMAAAETAMQTAFGN